MQHAAHIEDTDFLVVGCGPAGGIAAREAARGGVETLVLERDPVVGAKRVCAAGLRAGFCETFDLPRSIIHCDTPVIAMHDIEGTRYELQIACGHTSTREELDGTIGRSARDAGAEIRTSSLFRSAKSEGQTILVEYADLMSGARRLVRARRVFLAQGSSVRIDPSDSLGYPAWNAGLVTCYQYRVYLERPATASTYQTLEMHYYVGTKGRNVIAWVFPKRDHLAIGLGIAAKVPGSELRSELDAFMCNTAPRLFPNTAYTLREEGNLLYGGAPRPRLIDGNVCVGGTAAGLVDATTGEGIHEAAMSGRFAAEAAVRGDLHLYERLVKSTFYGRLRQRYTLMTFLERKPGRFRLFFEQLVREPRLTALLQHERNDFSFGEWMYLYMQVLRFGLRAWT
jgi:flavin-dependent dehydrogenase